MKAATYMSPVLLVNSDLAARQPGEVQEVALLQLLLNAVQSLAHAKLCTVNRRFDQQNCI